VVFVILQNSPLVSSAVKLARPTNLLPVPISEEFVRLKMNASTVGAPSTAPSTTVAGITSP